MQVAVQKGDTFWRLARAPGGVPCILHLSRDLAGVYRRWGRLSPSRTPCDLVQPGSQSVRFVPLSRNLLIVEVIIRENAESGQE